MTWHRSLLWEVIGWHKSFSWEAFAESTKKYFHYTLIGESPTGFVLPHMGGCIADTKLVCFDDCETETEIRYFQLCSCVLHESLILCKVRWTRRDFFIHIISFTKTEKNHPCPARHKVATLDFYECQNSSSEDTLWWEYTYISFHEWNYMYKNVTPGPS